MAEHDELSAAAAPAEYNPNLVNRQGTAAPAGYDPNRLLDALLSKMNVKTDADLARMLQVGRSSISKIRHGRIPVSASLLIRMNTMAGMEIRELRDLMGDRRLNYRISDADGKPRPHGASTADPDPPLH